MILSSFMCNLSLFLQVARGLAILNHLNSISGTELAMDWLIAGLLFIRRVWPLEVPTYEAYEVSSGL